MAYKLPAVHLFTIFEAAARHENFKSASAELFITPSAVSHQIKALEAHIGFELFQRKSRGVSLNAAGKMYLQYVQQGLDLLEQGTKRVTHKYASPTLKISCFTTLASNIIIPQIGAFQDAHPDIDIRIETGNQVADLRYDDVDLAIRVGTGDWPNLAVHKITDLRISAVCSQAFADKHQLSSIEQVKQLPLIDLTYMDDIWKTWAMTVGIDGLSSKRAITFSDYDSSIRAASQGLGLALGMFPIEKVQVERQLITTPFDEDLPFPQSLFAVYREEDKDRHDIQCFLNWLAKSPSLQA